MSIKVMTWAFELPLEPRAKFVLVAIGDNARDDGVAWPSRDTIAKKSSQSRATVNRRMRILSELGVLEVKERFREDGTQTTDEIRINLALTAEEVGRRVAARKKAMKSGVDGDDEDESDDATETGEAEGGGVLADTLPVQSSDPRAAVVTGGGLHSCNPLNEPSVEPKTPPNPPPGGDGPMRKVDKEAQARRDALWQRFTGAYPGITAMDQQAARSQFDHLSVDEAEWSVSSALGYAEECRKLKKPPKNAHIWLRKGMFKNFAKAEIREPRPDEVWIAEGSEEDRALRFAQLLTRQPAKFVRTRPDGSRGYTRPTPVGADLLALFRHFGDQTDGGWPRLKRGTDHFAAWQRRFVEWVGAPLPSRPGDPDCIRAPTLWPPKKDGTIYQDHDQQQEGDGDDGSGTAA